jgi:catechol 2,3-dioxygenase-like lactoylglutathione lyase family enzyme
MSDFHMTDSSPTASTDIVTPAVTAVDRLTLAVRDLDASEAIYTRLLGREPSWRRTNRTGGTDHVVYRLDNMAIELIAHIGSGVWGEQIQTFLDARGEGIVALFLATDNVEKTASLLSERGLPTVCMPANEGVISNGQQRRWRNTLMSRELSRNMTIIATQDMTKPAPPRTIAPLRAGISADAAISALDHVVVMTSDAEACKALFGAQFGIRLALDHSKPEWGVRQLFFRLGGVTIEVVESLDKTKAPKADFFWGVAWKTNDIRALCARLVAEGADVSEVRTGRKKGTEIATVRPPTGGVPTLLIGTLA